jgi:hypothetical protein
MIYTFVCWNTGAGAASIFIIWGLDMLTIISSCDLAGGHCEELFGLCTTLEIRSKSCIDSLGSVRAPLGATES